MALIKCRECGKEVSSEAKFCPNCGCPVNMIMQADKAVKEKDGKIGCVSGCLIGILIFVAFIAICSAMGSNYMSKVEQNTQTQTTTTVVNTVFNAPAFINRGEQRPFTEQELRNVMGEPDDIEEWNYTTGAGVVYPIRTLYYNGGDEYKFNNDTLRRVTLLKPIQFNSVDDFIEMFGCHKYTNTTINDTGAAYVVHNCGIYELHVYYENGETWRVDISYSDLFDKP